jgi:hypothetical protein
MKKLFNKTFAKKIIGFLIYGPRYKAPEYAYVRITQTSNKNIYHDKFQR